MGQIEPSSLTYPKNIDNLGFYWVEQSKYQGLRKNYKELGWCCNFNYSTVLLFCFKGQNILRFTTNFQISKAIETHRPLRVLEPFAFHIYLL